MLTSTRRASLFKFLWALCLSRRTYHHVSASSLRMATLRSGIFEDVVEDSEPEREETRRRAELQGQKQRSRLVTASVTAGGTSKSSMSSVNYIEISDEGTTATPGNEPANKQDGTSLRGLVQSNTVLVTAVASTVESLSSDSNEDDDRPQLNLKMFAYASGSKSTAQKAGPSRSISLPGSSTQQSIPPKRTKSGPTGNRFLTDFTDKQLGNVRKCVSCDASWTVRKSAAQKMIHIQACAKKHLLEDDTVRILLQRQINKALDLAQEKESSEFAKDLATTAAQNTIMEDIVNETAPKKKIKRQGSIKTVQRPTETREEILNRAQGVLSRTNSTSRDTQILAATQAFPPNRLERADGNDRNHVDPIRISKQGFHEDIDAQRKASSDISVSKEMQATSWRQAGPSSLLSIQEDSPPSTQSFAPSRLAGSESRLALSTSHQLSHVELADPSTSLIAGSVVRQQPFASNLTPLNFYRENEVAQVPFSTTKVKPNFLQAAPPRSPSMAVDEYDIKGQTENTDFIDYDHNDFDLANDDAFLHYIPDNNQQAESDTSSRSNDARTASKLPADRKKKSKATPIASETATVRRKEVLEKKRKKRDVKGKARETEETTIADWEEKMKRRISEDATLYLRILRYEPIHFEEFAKLAADEDLSSAKLRAQLRSFLDKEAINFYGAEPTTGRSRRR